MFERLIKNYQAIDPEIKFWFIETTKHAAMFLGSVFVIVSIGLIVASYQ